MNFYLRRIPSVKFQPIDKINEKKNAILSYLPCRKIVSLLDKSFEKFTNNDICTMNKDKIQINFSNFSSNNSNNSNSNINLNDSLKILNSTNDQALIKFVDIYNTDKKRKSIMLNETNLRYNKHLLEKRDEEEFLKKSNKISNFLDNDYQNFINNLRASSKKFYHMKLKSTLAKQKYLSAELKRNQRLKEEAELASIKKIVNANSQFSIIK